MKTSVCQGFAADELVLALTAMEKTFLKREIENLYLSSPIIRASTDFYYWRGTH